MEHMGEDRVAVDRQGRNVGELRAGAAGPGGTWWSGAGRAVSRAAERCGGGRSGAAGLRTARGRPAAPAEGEAFGGGMAATVERRGWTPGLRRIKQGQPEAETVS